MAADNPFNRFRRPSDIINPDKLLHETRRLLVLGLFVALAGYAAAGAYFMYARTERHVVQPRQTRLLIRPPRMTRSFGLDPVPVRRRELSLRPFERNIPPVGGFRLKEALPAPEFETPAIADSSLAVDSHLDGHYGIASLNTPSGDWYVPIGREPNRRLSMRDEMITLDDLDTGRYKAMVVQDPLNKWNVRGFVHIGLVWGTQLSPPPGLERSVINLAEAVNKYTAIDATVDNHVLLDSRKLHDMPFLYITADRLFELTEIEARNLGAYLRDGGFAVVDNAIAYDPLSPARASLRRMLRDALGLECRFEVIPMYHPLYHAFFDFHDAPPLGSETRPWPMPTQSPTAGVPYFGPALPREVYYLEGIWLNGRLAVVYSDKGYGVKWCQYPGLKPGMPPNNEPQLKIGVNFVVYALTQQGGMTWRNGQRFVEMR